MSIGYKTVSQYLEENNLEHNCASKFFESLAQILTHVTPDNFQDTAIAVKYPRSDFLGETEVIADIVDLYRPVTLNKATITDATFLAEFNAETGLSVDHLDAVYAKYDMYENTFIVFGSTPGIYIANDTVYFYFSEDLPEFKIGAGGYQVNLWDGNDIYGDRTGTRPVISSVEFLARGELGQITPVDASVNVVNSEQ